MKALKSKGMELLSLAKSEYDEGSEGTLKDFLKLTITEINKRKTWIRNRTKQIDELEQMQIAAVKSFDAGDFSDDHQRLLTQLNSLKSERVS